MPDLLLELFSEEIPARMQARAADDLRRLVTDGLVAAGLVYDGAKAFATPRRLALHVAGVPAASPDTREERKGPRVGAPDKAIQGFLRGAGLSSVDEATIANDPKKGDYFTAVVETPGRPAGDVIAEIVPEAIRRFPWPKSMRWGEGSLRWVRPLHAILCVFGPDTEDTDVVEFEIGGVEAGRTTRGHRFMAPEPFPVRRFDDYVKELDAAKVVLDADRRKAMIRNDAETRAFALGLEVVPDAALVDEVAGLVEWPVVLVGEFDPAFLSLPPEVVRLTIRNNQKCFVLRRPADGALTNRFVMVANIEAEDGGAAIAAGNERVIAARLADARFFWEQDVKDSLEVQADKLAGMTFHDKLGSQKERVDRIARLAADLAPAVGADAVTAARAARLCKADLVTEMVGEFPELQGVMGRYYALNEGEDAEIADAIRDHYRPAGQGDDVPTAPVSIAVALADKLDMLVGFWAIDEKPTGSKDPYALRRAALGVIRIVLKNGLRVRLAALAAPHLVMAGLDPAIHEAGKSMDARIKSGHDGGEVDVAADLLAFFADRLKVQLREEGARHDLVDAVFALGQRRTPTSPLAGEVGPQARVGGQEMGAAAATPLPPTPPHKGEGGADAEPAPVQDDLLMIVRRVAALGEFLDSEDGASLLTAYRRAANILRIEEKTDGRSYAEAPDPDVFAEDAERDLDARIAEVTAEADAALSREAFAGAMAALARLRGPVDTFFDEVTVNAEDQALRANRLKLLSRIRAAMDRVADFSRIAG